MKSTELRIGNLILANGNVTEVENISEYGINGSSWSDTHHGNISGGFDYDFRFDQDEIKGIELTEDLCKRFGLTRVGRSNEWSIDLSCETKLVVNFFRGSVSIMIETDEQYITLPLPPEVHWLQNVFHSHKNEELKLK